jgi:hypothetical protein
MLPDGIVLGSGGVGDGKRPCQLSPQWGDNVARPADIDEQDHPEEAAPASRRSTNEARPEDIGRAWQEVARRGRRWTQRARNGLAAMAEVAPDVAAGVEERVG